MVHSNERPKKTDSPKVVVGEIDTRAPFHSVKDAVNLFGEVASSGEKPAIKKVKPQSAEKVLVKQTQLHLAQKELNKLQEQLQNAENTKSEALLELEKVKRTVEELSHKLKVLTESKEASIQATEAAKEKAKQLEDSQGDNLPVANVFSKEDSETAREQYSNIFSELNSAKQELAKIRQDYDSSSEAKATATNQAERAELASKEHFIRASELSKEISAMKETIEQVKQASARAQDERAKIFAEKELEKQSYKAKLEESAKKVEMMKGGFDPDVARNLETQLDEAMSEIEGLKKEVESVRESDINLVEAVTCELDVAKESLRKMLEEEKTLLNLVESLKRELEDLRKEHSELREKEAETESVAGNLHVKLRICKSELETRLAEEAKVNGASDEMIATLNQLIAETENAKRESEEMKVKAEELKKEAEETRLSLEEAEKKLKLALVEAEVAEKAEARARDEIKAFSEQTDAARSSTSESGSKIRISRDEFQALSRKSEESEKLAEMKVEAAIAQVEAVKASENEALKRLEATEKEIEDIKGATQEALKKAQSAEAAKTAVESELRRWREREQKKAAEAASRILAEAQAETKPGPVDYKIGSSEKAKGGRKFEKQRSSMSKKVLLPNLSGIFHKNKNQVDGESPSYLPGET